MTETLVHRAPLARWQGEKAVYHLVKITGDVAEALAAHALMQRLEFGRRRGFGSVKVIATIGDTRWKTSVFPQKVSSDETPATHALHPSTRSLTGDNPGGRVEGAGGVAPSRKQWILLVSKKVMRAEDLAPGDAISVELTLL